jgi:hypothetical protein
MSLMTAEGSPPPAVVPSVVSNPPGGASDAPTGKTEHSGGSAYACPACHQVEDSEG